MSLTPLNGHVQIEPVEQDSFISSSRTAYEEIGKVIRVATDISQTPTSPIPSQGDKVYFDSWMAAKYPNGKDGFYWLVPYSSIRAYEPISEQ